ncbi:hypothetical protein EVB32_051 [Rhizobium phage RHph_TM39]|uniref:Uncharacterized protein n=1 Tax=Rhizobium phage RHph_TM30 TaxID=2509764 RepID=A0A7S5R4U4_9CAUD|nr:hypothetical protein PQC16_gp051 [Rhizobium phage RHph_TM30]QIG71158.1 hypothetical protein EVB93_051 [Rhizobium phage RHph_TM30]QIG77039.1 hypothetical protein EVB32_051 [Rhizobium phage RHph_TM39]QIG77638.1 hypothetical protein EVB64_051 [Rhizobium phage RHph_TM61]
MIINNVLQSLDKIPEAVSEYLLVDLNVFHGKGYLDVERMMNDYLRQAKYQRKLLVITIPAADLKVRWKIDAYNARDYEIPMWTAPYSRSVYQLAHIVVAYGDRIVLIKGRPDRRHDERIKYEIHQQIKMLQDNSN